VRVNPSYVSDLAGALDRTTLAEQQLSAQLASGSRVNRLSDDPVAAGQNAILLAQLSRDDSFTQAADSATGQLQVTDSALGNVVDQLTQAISIATSGLNGTLNASNLQSIGNQLAGIRDEVLSLANTSYLGQYVFAGSQTATQPFTLDTSTTPATVTYHGDPLVRTLATPNGQSIGLNLPGDQIFTAAGGDVLGTLNTLIAEFASGSPAAISASDVGALSTSLSHLSQQRVLLDDSLSRLTAAESSARSDSTQVTVVQTDLMQADTASIATRLSTAETQQSALSNVIATLARGSLFDYLQ
jgi:flagellar hook-associated protein 3 FlgL